MDFGRELSEAAGTAVDEQSWAARHGVEIIEQAAQTPQALVIAQYTTRPPRIVLYTEAVRFAEAVIDILQWRTDFGDQPVRSLAIRHEIAHRTLDGAASRELSRRLGVRSLRLGPIRLTGHVVGADELVCHAFAQHQLPTYPPVCARAGCRPQSRGCYRLALVSASIPHPEPGPAGLEEHVMGIVIILAMLATALLIVSRRLPTLVGMVGLAVVVALLGGAPWGGAEGVSGGVIAAGSIMLASTMIAVLLGSWLAAVMEEAGIASTLVRKIVELGGESPYFVAFGMFIAATLVGMVAGSAPAAMLVGLVGIPTMIAVGLPPTTSVGIILIGMAAGEPLQQTDWQFYTTATHVSLSTVRSFGISIFPIVLAVGIAYVLIETWRRGRVRTWAMTIEAPVGDEDATIDAPGRRAVVLAAVSASTDHLRARLRHADHDITPTGSSLRALHHDPSAKLVTARPEDRIPRRPDRRPGASPLRGHRDDLGRG